MDILFLLSQEDRAKVPSNLLVENLNLRPDIEIQDELLLNKYDTCFITSNYTKIYGTSVVKNVITLLRNLTTTRIHYLLEHEDEANSDPIIPFLIELGIGNITVVDIEKLQLIEFQRLARMDETATGMEIGKTTLPMERILLMKDELEAVTESESANYINKNKGKILDLIQAYIEILVRDEENSRRMDSMLVELKYLDKLRLENAGQIQSLQSKYNMTKRDLKELRESVIQYKDNINDYNRSIIDNDQIDYPLVYLDDLAPNIIYFKEIEDIGFYNFFESIVYTLSSVYKIYIKSLVLERSNRHFYNPYVKDGYITISDDATMKTIINNDKMVKYGNPTDLLKKLASPEMRTEIILIFDRLGTENLVVNAPYIQPYYISNYRDPITTLDISDISLLSPYEGNWTSIKQLLNHKTMEEDEKLIYRTFATQHPFTNYIVKSVVEPTEDGY